MDYNAFAESTRGVPIPSWLLEGEKDAAKLEQSLQAQLDVVSKTQGQSDTWARLANARDTASSVRQSLDQQIERIVSSVSAGASSTSPHCN